MFDELQGLSLILAVATAAFIAWEIFGIATSAGKIQMKARIYGRYISLGLIVALIGFAVFQRRADLDTVSMWILMGGVIISSVLYVFMPTGFGEKGLYFNGRLHTFESIDYYNIERESDRGFTLRLKTTRREFALDFRQEEKPLAMAWMEKGKLIDFKTHLESGRR